MAADGENLFGTGLSVDWLRGVLEQSCGAESALLDWHAERIGVGQGFMSHLVRVTFEWQQEASALPASVVVKVPTMETGKQYMSKANMDEITVTDVFGDRLLAKIHHNECEAYDWLREHAVPIAFGTKFYSSDVLPDKKGVLVMQDFHADGHMVQLTDGLALTQVYQLAESIAKWQAVSLRTSDWQTRVQFSEDETMLKELPKFFASSKKMLKELRPTYFDQLDLLDDCFTAQAFRAGIMSAQTLGLAPVFCHGDLWTNNFIFRKTQPDRLLAIIDWQGSHPGNCAEDLSRVLLSSVDGDVRRRETANVLDFYYAELQKHYGDDALPFSRDDVDRAYRHIMRFSMSLILVGLPFMCMSPIVDGDDKQAKIERLLYRGKCMAEDVLQLPPAS